MYKLSKGFKPPITGSQKGFAVEYFHEFVGIPVIP
jgi:hypothetical protein